MQSMIVILVQTPGILPAIKRKKLEIDRDHDQNTACREVERVRAREREKPHAAKERRGDGLTRPTACTHVSIYLEPDVSGLGVGVNLAEQLHRRPLSHHLSGGAKLEFGWNAGHGQGTGVGGAALRGGGDTGIDASVFKLEIPDGQGVGGRLGES